ncbi:MAG TPA: hypothetical protein O0W88_05020, partial [Methanocorpusculum sp.]|nr:hypothetical protein [Methanocorpusculum sp.]
FAQAFYSKDWIIHDVEPTSVHDLASRPLRRGDKFRKIDVEYPEVMPVQTHEELMKKHFS